MGAATRDPLGLTGVVLDGKFVVEHAIGEGGAAVVYRGTHTTAGDRVAIKFLYTLAQAPEEERKGILEEFLREGRLIADLSAQSNAIVRSRDVGILERPGQTPMPYLVLEWLDGRTLDEVLVAETNGGIAPRSFADATKLLEPIAEALAVAHQRGVAHRDVKPENIFLVERETQSSQVPGSRIKLLDFGIAKVMKKRVSGIHQTGTLPTAFTPHYGAPEQFSRTYGETGTWSDVFAMALVILEVMRGGRRAFEGDDYVELARQSCDVDRRPTPRAIGLAVTDEIEAVFGRALAVQSAHRYTTMGEFWTALMGAANPKAALPSSGPASAGRPPVAPTLVTGPPKRRGIIFFATVAALLLIVAAAVTAGVKLAGKKTGTGNGKEPAGTGTGTGAGTVSGTGNGPSAPSSAPVASSSAITSSAGVCPAGAVVVAGGRFQMGSSTDEGNGPRHTVFIDTFCLDRFEVTAKAFQACIDVGSCTKPATTDVVGPADACTIGNASLGEHPANCVTFDDASTMCAFRGMRLPTEAEWEVAASRGADGAAPWDQGGPIEERANLESKDRFDKTAPVGSFLPGATKEGIADLVGNVAEWQGDWFQAYPPGEALNPKGPSSGTKRSVRGGAFTGYCVVENTTLPSGLAFDVTHREALVPGTRSVSVGFRCAADISRAKGE